MSKFMIGDRIREINLGHTGEVTSSFTYRDVSGNPPKYGLVPVQWDNGEPTYVNPNTIEYDEVYEYDVHSAD
jgi:hypothetical protein